MARKKTEKKKTTIKTPLQIVKERFGDKKSLVSQLAGQLERREGESKGDFEARLSKVSSQKLLNLLERYEEATKLGGRKALVEAIHDYTGRQAAKGDTFKEDKDFKAYLGKKSLGALLDQYKTIQKHLRAQAK